MLLCVVLLKLFFVLALSQGSNVFTFDMSKPTAPFPHVWEECVGSGHASLSLRKDYQDHLRRAHDDLGFKRVRFHGVLDDDMSVFQFGDNGQPVYSFFNVDESFDFLVSIGMQPYVELSFMPEDLASGPQTIMHYKGNITPPKNYTMWDTLIVQFMTHLVSRYGLKEVSTWSFEVWNEPNCGFFYGSQQDYFTHYAHTANAIKSVNSALRVGGPVTCMSGWLPDFINYCKQNNVPYDFIATHEYPTDINPPTRNVLSTVFQKARQEVGNVTLYYSEFNDGLYSNPAYHDTTFASAFVIKEMHDVRNYVDLLSWWTFSDIFEEQGQTSQPFFIVDGWGLLNIYEIAKPTFRAFELLHNMGTQEVAVTANATSTTVGAWGVLSDKGAHLEVFIYNFDVPANPVVNETVSIVVNNLKAVPQSGTLLRIDDANCNAPQAWLNMGSPWYPSAAQIKQMKDASEFQPQKINFSKAGSNSLTFQLTVPKWGVAMISIPL